MFQLISSKMPCSFYTTCPLLLVSQMWIPESSPGVCCLTIRCTSDVVAPEITVTVKFGILIQKTRGKNTHQRPNDFAHACWKIAYIFHPRQGLICFLLLGKAPLKKNQFSKSLVFSLFLNIFYGTFDCEMKAIHSF